MYEGGLFRLSVDIPARCGSLLSCLLQDALTGCCASPRVLPAHGDIRFPSLLPAATPSSRPK